MRSNRIGVGKSGYRSRSQTEIVSGIARSRHLSLIAGGDLRTIRSQPDEAGCLNEPLSLLDSFVDRLLCLCAR